MMEVLQCDGCDFLAESYDDLKSHIQEVHTAFLQPADADESDSLRDEAEDDGEAEDDTDKEDKDYTSVKARMSPSSAKSPSQASQKQPAETHPPFYQCKFCVRYFRSKGFLRIHTKKVHSVANQDSETNVSPDTAKQSGSPAQLHNDNSQVFSCEYCTYKSKSQAGLLKHQLTCRKVSSDSAAAAAAEDSAAEDESDSLSEAEGATFACEWCDYQTDQKESWTSHVLKEHSNKVKIVSTAKKLGGGAQALSSKRVSSSPLQIPTTSKSSLSEKDDTPGATIKNTSRTSTPVGSAIPYSQICAATPNSTGSSILSRKFVSSSNSVTNTSLVSEENSRSSLEEEDEEDGDDDEDVGDIDDPSYTGTLSADAKQLLTDDDNKLLETKGIPFRKFMNRFQCPFCSFLTMHRRSISRHIENIHLSGKATVYKCDECPFTCTSPLKLGTHKQTHTSSDLETMDLTGDSPDPQNESATESVNGGSISTRVNGKKSTSTPNDQQNPHRCTLCSFSTTTLKGLRVHQQHKHSYCDDLDSTVLESHMTDNTDSEVEASPVFVQKTQTPILGLATKKSVGTGKRARKSINDLPLDLSSVKKRTRIDEIASNLQSKISQSQQDTVINLDDMEDEDAGDNSASADEDRNHHNSKIFAYSTQQLHAGESAASYESGRKRKSNPKSKSRSVPMDLAFAEDGDHIPGDLNDSAVPDHLDFTDEPGTTRFYCKHCDYHNKSARSVSTHYQRMHPYIKFSFKYILDPEDQSAVFRCLECFIEYTNYNDLHQHYMDHHPEASNVLNFNQPHLLYMCRFCSYTSPNVRSLMPHYQRMHPTVKINNAMIFSSYIVEQTHKSGESQTLREILNSGPKNFNSSSAMSTSSASPVLKSVSKSPEATTDADAAKESASGNVVVYDCDVCSFSSPNMHSVLVHYQKKHPEQKASYFRIQKTMKVISVDQSQPVANSTFSPSLSAASKQSSATLYGTEEDMFYCKHCVYSNRSVVGVLVHYQKRHPEVKVTAKYIKHGPPTPALMKLMDDLQIAAPKQFLKQLQNNGCDGTNSSSPKPGGGEKGEDELFFCQHCDYGNRTVKGVLIHYQKKHRETKANADLVRRHTAVVRSQRERAQMVQAGSTSSAATAASAPSDPDNAAPLRSLKCKHCSFTSPYVYALKKHLKKEHPTVKATAMTILHWAYQDGILEAGYHCEWCIYSHAEPQGLLLHYQKRHPEHNVDYAYMASKLWAGPETTQQGGSSEAKHYKCRDCAFEACSIWDITSHYQAVHPWAIKVDESVLLDIIKGNSSGENIHQQVAKEHAPPNCLPMDEEGALVIDTSPQESTSHSTHPRLSISNNPYQCTVCLSEYNSLHGLLTHYGKKHPGMKVKAADFAQEADINPSSVYKCRHCPYVNSRIHGVLTHYQKRHPLVKVTAEDFADDIEHITELHDGDDKFKTQRQGYGAYRCKMCPYTHGTLEKLKIHYEKYHNQSASDMFSASAVSVTSPKEVEALAACSGGNPSTAKLQEACELDFAVSQLPVNKPEKHAVFKCQLCKYFCSTRKGIARHYRIKHNNVRAQPEGKNNVFKCALCSYTNPIRKGLAAHYQKRHDIDAYYTHCLAASKTLSEKPCKVVAPLPSEGESSEMSEELRTAIEKRRCNLCSFQAFSRKSIVSHYIKRHPGVFPKKQHSSKLGRYFTVIYAKEPDKDVSALAEEEADVTDVPVTPEQDTDADWLPFKCLKCFKLSFRTGQLLSMHYNDHHNLDLKRDFLISPSTAEENEDSELYQCSHCELDFLTLPDLAKHLLTHNEEFEKRAMRQERRKQLIWKQRVKEPPETKPEKESLSNNTPVGFRCNFCVEIHPTLRAICNHLRKHVQYGEAKEGHVKQEVTEAPLTPPLKTLTNGDLDTDEAAEQHSPERPSTPRISSAFSLTAPAGGSCARTTAADVQPKIEAVDEKEAATATHAAVSDKQLKLRLAGGGHPCAQCDRIFMSMQGLRSHERSHSAMALFSREDKYSCQYCQFVSPFRHNLDRHMQTHHGQHKPFKCKFCPFKSAYASRLKSHLLKAHTGEQHTYKCSSCPFSTMTISQLKEHSLRDHGEVLTLHKLRAASQAAHAALRPFRLVTNSEQAPITSDDPIYLEPPDVRQQLNHYKLASCSQISPSAKAVSPAAFDGRPDVILTCEFCEFSSGYMQSLRRHYRDRHGGKKLFKCKDCSFFTCSKNSFIVHVEAGHNNNSPPPELPADLRCPLCLYHTQHKSNMIDHIVLHREERVAPLEVSRSKLSRHLQGLVFRCHKCTFTSSSDQTLQLHLQKHQEIRPYHCQLCYYDSSRQSQVEEHLRSEHKVIRNFELMVRVNLDQLDVLKEQGTGPEEKEKGGMMRMMINEQEPLEEEGEEEAEGEDEEGEEDEGVAVEEFEDDEDAMEMMNNAVDEEGLEDSKEKQTETKVEHVKEEEEEQEVKEAEGEKPVWQEALASPSSSSSSSGANGAEKRLPCEFCGRCFTNSQEWERHVLRHGMVVNSTSGTSSAPADLRTEQPGNGQEEGSLADPQLTGGSRQQGEEAEKRHTKKEEEESG